MTQPRRWTRRSLLLALAGAGLSVPACDFSQLFSWNGGKPTLFGYATAPNFNRQYKTIRIKIFKDPTFWAAVPVPNLEEELTEIIVQQIEQKTPYKVCSGDADTELSGSIVSFLQLSLNYNQMNEIREIETTMTCAVRWKDLRTGQSLSAPPPRNLEPLPPAGLLPGQQDPLTQAGVQPGSFATQPLSAAGVSPGGNPATMGTSPPPTTGNPAPGVTNAMGPPGGAPLPAPALGNSMLDAVLVRSVAHYRPEIGESIATAEWINCQRMAEQIVNMMEVAW